MNWCGCGAALGDAMSVAHGRCYDCRQPAPPPAVEQDDDDDCGMCRGCLSESHPHRDDCVHTSWGPPPAVEPAYCPVDAAKYGVEFHADSPDAKREVGPGEGARRSPTTWRELLATAESRGAERERERVARLLRRMDFPVLADLVASGMQDPNDKEPKS